MPSPSFRRVALCAAFIALSGAILKNSRALNNPLDDLPASPQNPTQSTVDAASTPRAVAADWQPSRVSYRGQILAPDAPDYPPAIAREFRAAWVATVFNMDWPSKSGLSSTQQQAEIRVILDRAVALKLNALIWQVRPMCDAFYRSPHEPWSRFLSGKIGVDPGYDPLQFIVEESRARGLEVHAWFNPYRAGTTAQTDYPANHISKTHPDWIVAHGKNLWLNPAMPQVANYVTKVMRDVVRRYDIDGVHLDDYFYPYPAKDESGAILPFDDEISYQKYRNGGGGLARDDWRRDVVNRLVRRLGEMVHSEKRDVKFGISPFGIWRPGYPRGIKGMDAWAEIYADSRLWLQKGWVDYLTPQLYWSIDNPPQSYPILLRWWNSQNTLNRHLWPGHGAHRIPAPTKTAPAVTTGAVNTTIFSVEEILRQVQITRAQKGASGDVFFNMSALMGRRSSLGAQLSKRLYADAALVPPSPWLDARAPSAPKFQARWNVTAREFELKWQADDRQKVARWTLQTRDGQRWKTQILPAAQRELKLGKHEIFALSAVDRAGNQSAPIVIRARK